MEYVGWPNGSTSLPLEPQNMLPGRIEGYPQGTQRGNNNAEDLLATAVAYWDASQYRDGDRFLRNRGIAGDLLDLRLGSSITPNTNDPKFLDWDGENYVYLPGSGTGKNTITCEAPAVTGDIDIRVQISDYADTAYRTFYSVCDSTPNLDVAFYNSGSANMRLAWNESGTARLADFGNRRPDILALAAANERAWVRVTLDVDNGAGQYEAKMWLSSDGASWTQSGSTVTGSTGPTAITYRGSAYPARIGGTPSRGWDLSASIHRVQVLDGINGTTVLDVDCSQITSGSNTSFTALTGQTVTINRSTSGRKSVAVTHPCWLFGTDDYMEVTDNWQHQLLNFDAGDSFTVLAVARPWPSGFVTNFLGKESYSPTRGWSIGSSFYAADANDPATKFLFTSTNAPMGTKSTLAMSINRASRLNMSYINGVPTIINMFGRDIGSLWVSGAFRIGVTNTYSNLEFTAAAIFRRALTPAEIKTISDYFTARIA